MDKGWGDTWLSGQGAFARLRHREDGSPGNSLRTRSSIGGPRSSLVATGMARKSPGGRLRRMPDDPGVDGGLVDSLSLCQEVDVGPLVHPATARHDQLIDPEEAHVAAS